MSATVISALLIQALISVESHGNDRALGDYVHGRPTSFGCLQISLKVLTDVSKITGHKVGVEDAFNRPMAVKICLVYLSHYATEDRLGHAPTDQDLARIWNGGPNGWADPKTMPYWRKISRSLKQLSPARLRVGRTIPNSREPRALRACQPMPGLTSGDCCRPTERPNTNRDSGRGKLSPCARSLA